jgi:ATP phosphoribosyltransferase
MQTLKLLVPKGRIFDNIAKLFEEAGYPLKMGERAYRPGLGADWLEVKVMKPQNVGELLEMGAHDAGFTGLDWIRESKSSVKEVLDLGFDRVKIVAAAPKGMQLGELKDKTLVAATEYVNLAESWLKMRFKNYKIVRTYGATEVFPPDDADIIIDNSASGQTLVDNGLEILDVLLESSTRFVASERALENSWKREKIEELAMLFRAVLEGRSRVMLEMNVDKEHFKALVGGLPAMRSPTVSPLYDEGAGSGGFAVKIAVKKNEVATLLPELKRLGAVDILEYPLRKVVP